MESVAYQASLSMGFSRREYWSGLPFKYVLDQEGVIRPGEASVSLIWVLVLPSRFSPRG